LRGSDTPSGEAVATDDESVVVRRSEGGETFWVVARFKAAGDVDVAQAAATLGHELSDVELELVLDTEHAEFAADPQAIAVTSGSGSSSISFARPGAVILKER
jgi:hypothetical protein